MLTALLSLVLSQSVVMDVTVVDKKGVPVTGLTAADFVVLEDAKPVRVSAVDSVSVSPEAADGRIAVLFMDDSTPSPTGEGKHAREIAHHFIDALGPTDVAGVLFAAGASGVQALTTDRVSLRAAVNRFEARVGNWSTSNSDTGNRLVRGGFDRYDSGSIALYRTTLQSLYRLIGRLSVIENRRKAIVMISSGVPFTPPDPRKLAVDDPTGTADAVLEDMRMVIRAAQMARVTIYTVDPGGLRLAVAALDEVTSLTAEAPAPRVAAVGRPNQAFLRSLSINTGGFATVNTNDTRAAATGIMKDLSGYYLIRFDSDQADDRFRAVSIRVNRPGVTVRARPGYWPSR
jgi:VWFA-related protein